MIDCSNCKHIYIHEVAWGEFWCDKFNKYIYSLHALKERFRKECNYFKEGNRYDNQNK